MKRYTFTTQKTMDVLPDGRARIYFDEVLGEEVIEMVPEGKKKPVSEKYAVYSYRAVDIPAGVPVDKAAVVNAIIRAGYSQDAVEAIFRHKLAGEKSDEFKVFNDVAEAAKARAVEILSK